MYNTRTTEFVLGKRLKKKCPDEIPSAGHHSNKLGRVYCYFTFSETGWMNKMMGRLARFIRLNAFSSKAMIKQCMAGLLTCFCWQAPSRKHGFQWLLVFCLQHIMKLTAAGLFRTFT